MRLKIKTNTKKLFQASLNTLKMEIFNDNDAKLEKINFFKYF